VISYAAVMFAYVRLRRTQPHLVRPYRSPLGSAGAWTGALLALMSLAATCARAEYRPGVYGVAAILVCAVLYFALYSSRRLVAEAPEERAALHAEIVSA
jgi:ethanolamine permease